MCQDWMDDSLAEVSWWPSIFVGVCVCVYVPGLSVCTGDTYGRGVYQVGGCCFVSFVSCRVCWLSVGWWRLCMCLCCHSCSSANLNSPQGGSSDAFGRFVLLAWRASCLRGSWMRSMVPCWRSRRIRTALLAPCVAPSRRPLPFLVLFAEKGRRLSAHGALTRWCVVWPSLLHGCVVA